MQKEKNKLLLLLLLLTTFISENLDLMNWYGVDGYMQFVSQRCSIDNLIVSLMEANCHLYKIS